jgi:hypothetical protein
LNNDSDKYYELLGVAPGASGQELKDAYRDLAKVWHPDRFSQDPRLQQKAQEKLKEINEAYAQLTSGNAARRTRTAPAQGEPHAPAREPARRRRPRLALFTAAVFCAVFVAALSSLVSTGAPPTPDPPPPTERKEAQPSDNSQQPESVARTAPGQPARGKGRPTLPSPAEAASGGEPDNGPSAAALRPVPTVTVAIDPANGLLATKDCPAPSRTSYPAGAEPRQYCTAPHKTKAALQADPARPQDSRLKSMGKRLAAPVRWLGGGKGADAVDTRNTHHPNGGSPEN